MACCLNNGFHSNEYELFKMIEEKNNIQVVCYQKMDVVRHVGLAFLDENSQGYTVDFAASLAYSNPTEISDSSKKNLQILKAALNGRVEGKVSVNRFDGQKSKTIEVIKQVPISSFLGKEKVKQKITDLLNLDMGKYSLISNNCRSYVNKAGELLFDYFKEDCTSDLEEIQMNESQFFKKVKKIQSNDKIALGCSLFSALVCLITVVLLPIIFYFIKKKKHQENLKKTNIHNNWTDIYAT